jgi:hypothetical protein
MNLKLARGLNPRATHENTLVMRRSLDGGEDQGAEVQYGVGAENSVTSPHATWAYSWIRPPSRSRRSTRIFAPIAGGRERPAGGFSCSVLCGRWVL